MADRKPSSQRGFLSFGVILLIAVIIGIFIRNVRLGLLIGLALGLLGSVLIRRR